MRDTILYGDCRQTLKQFDEQARMCVTSPPYYGLRDYGGENNQIGQEQTPDDFIEQLITAFKTHLGQVSGAIPGVPPIPFAGYQVAG